MDGKNVMAIVNQIKKYDICIWIINYDEVWCSM